MHTSGMNKIAPQADEESDIDIDAITDEEFSEMMGDYDYDGPGIPIEEVFAELERRVGVAPGTFDAAKKA